MNNLFDYYSWRETGNAIDTFYKCVLKQQMGEYPVGTEFKTIEIDYHDSIINLDGKKFNLNFSVGEAIDD